MTPQDPTGNPLFFCDGIETATLVLHGEDDKRVPLGQGVGFYRGLQRASRFPERMSLVTYPGEGHQIKSKAHGADVLARLVEHFQKWL